MKFLWIGTLIVILCATSFEASSQTKIDEVRDVQIGDPLRKIMLDALRPVITEDLDLPVSFIVKELRVQGNWAFFAGEPRNSDGSAIDFTQTYYLQKQSVFDEPYLEALMENQNGVWVVKAFDIGSTDVVASYWAEEFGSPCAVIGYFPDPCY